MTEQPVETEQQFLGNETVSPVVPAGTYVPDSAPLDALPLTEDQLAVLRKARQHYVPNAHLRRPSWAPGDDVELASLVRKCTNAARLLAIAKTESVKAEAALQHALDVEHEAGDKLHEAEKTLLAFTRKDSGL